MSSTGRRWLARAAFALMIAAAVLLLVAAGWRTLTILLLSALGVLAMLAGAYWFLSNRGVLRWLALALVIAALAGLLVLFAWHHLIWVAIAAVGAVLLAGVLGRRALRASGQGGQLPGGRATRPRHPFLIMNPRSGGGKVGRFGLKEKAEALGAEVALLEGPGTADVAALARKAVADGADLLGAAGGDGTQALVAGIAAEHDLPFLVISAGTRNHFALDLGLDRDDPATCLTALTDGEELRIDLGVIGDRTFVNNASFGAYAEVVRSPAYRDDKRRTTLEMLPDLLKGQAGARLSARAGDTGIDAPQHPRRHRRGDGTDARPRPMRQPAQSIPGTRPAPAPRGPRPLTGPGLDTTTPACGGPYQDRMNSVPPVPSMTGLDRSSIPASSWRSRTGADNIGLPPCRLATGMKTLSAAINRCRASRRQMGEVIACWTSSASSSRRAADRCAGPPTCSPGTGRLARTWCRRRWYGPACGAADCAVRTRWNLMRARSCCRCSCPLGAGAGMARCRTRSCLTGQHAARSTP